MKKCTAIAKRACWGIFCLLGILLTAGCSSSSNNAGIAAWHRPFESAGLIINPPNGSLLLEANTYAGDALGSMLQQRVGSSGAILATTMVNLEDLDKSSPFGRASMQQISSRLGQRGFKVLEARLGAELRMDKREGEFMLTRDSMQLLARAHDAHAALVGAYSVGVDQVFVSVRIVRLNDCALIGAYEYYLPLRDDVVALLGSEPTSAWQRYSAREQAFPQK